MRERSENWAKLAARGRFGMDVAAVIGGVEYTAISAPVIDRALFSDTLSVGNCISASMKVSVLTDNVIPKSAPVIIKARIYDGNNTSEWLTFGTFYIDRREENSGLITLQCYDAMLKTNQGYVDPSDSQKRIGWPKSMKLVVEEIAERIGVEIDSRTVIKTSEPYQVAYPEDYTMQQVLGFIGACHGGNWIITPENKLRLIPIISPPSETFDIIDYEYNKIYTDDGYKLVWQHYESSEPIVNTAGGDLLNVPVVIDKITTSKRTKISRVTLTGDDNRSYTLGDDSGTEIRIESNPYVCQAICNDLYAALNGIEYAPFTISKACYDPCAELGDWILVGDEVRSVIYSQKITLGTDFRADASAPGKDETSSEYPYLTEVQKLRREDERLKAYVDEAKDAIDSKIEQTQTSIMLEVGGTYATKEEVSARITLTEKSITAEVARATAAEGTLSSRITQTAESITAEIIRATAAEEELSAKVELTAESITSTLESKITEESDRAKQAEQGLASDLLSGLDDIEGEIVTVKSEMISQIEQTAESITLSVEAKITAETDRATAAELSLSSSITQTAESITAEVTRAKGAENTLSSRITQTADSITSEITRAKAEEAKLSTKISQTFDNITLSVSETTSNNQTTSTFTLKNGSAVIDTASVTGTTAAQAATIAADAVNGITLSVTNSTTAATSTLTLKNGNVTIASGTIELKGLVTFSDLETKGKTEINGDNITTGTISADRIDASKLYIDKIYTRDTSKRVAIDAASNNNLAVGSGTDNNSNAIQNVYIIGQTKVAIGQYYASGYQSYHLIFDTVKHAIHPASASYVSASTDWYLGTSDYPFGDLHVKSAHIGNYQGKVGFFGTNPASRQTVAQLGTSATLAQCVDKINSLLTALKNYGLLS